MAAEAPISELSSAIGELRSFAAQQVATNERIFGTNERMLQELSKIGEKMSGFIELSATFAQYRDTLHERFGKLHEDVGDIEDIAEKSIERIAKIEIQQAEERASRRTAVNIAMIGGSVGGSLLSWLGPAVYKVLIGVSR